MKILLSLVAFTCLWFSTTAQTVIHPVIEKVQAVYKPVPVAAQSSTAAAAPEIRVKATLDVTLKNGHDAVKIYLKMIDKQGLAPVYEVSYPLNASDVNVGGIVTFKKQGNVITMTNPATVTLKPFIYELYTEDATGKKSSVYSIIQ